MMYIKPIQPLKKASKLSILCIDLVQFGKSKEIKAQSKSYNRRIRKHEICSLKSKEQAFASMLGCSTNKQPRQKNSKISSVYLTLKSPFEESPIKETASSMHKPLVACKCSVYNFFTACFLSKSRWMQDHIVVITTRLHFLGIPAKWRTHDM